MKTRPKVFLRMGGFFAAVALSIPVQIMILYGHSPFEWSAIWSKVAPMNKVVMTMCLLCAGLSLRASPFLRLALPLTVVAVGWNNWVVGATGADFSPLTAFGSFAFFLAAQVGWLHPEARALLADGSRRWWLTPRRKRAALPVFVNLPRGKTFKAQSYDISNGGLFLAFGIRELNHHPDAFLNRLEVGQRLELNIVLNPLRTLACEVEVVRLNLEPTGAYPAGVGLRYVAFHGTAKQELDQLMAA